jgi:hypothetical protein
VAANSKAEVVKVADSSFSPGYFYSAAQHLSSKDAHISGLWVLGRVFGVPE